MELPEKPIQPGSRGCILLDRDGVINHDSSNYIRSPQQWRPIRGSLEAIAALCDAGFAPVIVSNQSGVGRGLLSAAAGGQLAGIYHCPHAPVDGCGCRKPAVGMIRRMERELGFVAAGAPLIGDKGSDLELARRVGARPILVRTGYGSQTMTTLEDSSVEIFADLARAAAALTREPPR